MVRGLRGRRHAVSSNIDYKVQNGKLMINGGQMPTLATSAALVNLSLRKKSSECTG